MNANGGMAYRFDDAMGKLPALTLVYWIMKVSATTLGETAGDLMSMTMELGYLLSTVILLSVFLATVTGQLSAKRHHPWLYWLVIITSSTAGTTLSDWMDRTLGLGYFTGSLCLVSLLLAVFAYWRFLTPHSMSVTNVRNFKIELLYWVAVLVSNTLGTALGDFLSDDSGLGFAGVSAVLSGILALVVAANYFTRVSTTVLFWLAFVTLQPFGATLGDTLTKETSQGGLGFGTIAASAVLITINVVGMLYVTFQGYQFGKAKQEAGLPAFQ